MPPLFTVEPHPDEVEFLSDLRAYDTQNLAWYGIRARGKKNGERDVLYPEGAEAGTDKNKERKKDESEEELFEFPEGRYGKLISSGSHAEMRILECN